MAKSLFFALCALVLCMVIFATAVNGDVLFSFVSLVAAIGYLIASMQYRLIDALERSLENREQRIAYLERHGNIIPIHRRANQP